MDKPNLATCTFQEAADYAVFKVVEQGKQCINEQGLCIYGDEAGNHCAIGWLLDPNNEALMKAGEGAATIISYFGLNVGDKSHLAFNVLQDFHDAKEKEWRLLALERLKTEHNLDTTPPQYQQWVEMGR